MIITMAEERTPLIGGGQNVLGQPGYGGPSSPQSQGIVPPPVFLPNGREKWRKLAFEAGNVDLRKPLPLA